MRQFFPVGPLFVALCTLACGATENGSGGTGAVGGAGAAGGIGGEGGHTPVVMQRVFFVSEEGDLFQASLDESSGAIQLSKAPQLLPSGERAGHVSYYAVSPDGRYVAYEGNFDEVPSGLGPELHVVPVGGGPSTRLDRDLGARGPPFAWSPAADRVAYVSQVGITSEFVVSTLDAVRTIIDEVGDNVSSFGWGPGNNQLTFSRSAYRDQTDSGIFVASSDGSMLVRLGARGLWFWSPDGSRVAYQADVENRGVLELFSVLPDGVDPRKASGDLGAREIAWAPDGRRISFLSWYESGMPQPPELYTVLADGTDSRRVNRPLAAGLPGLPGNVLSPHWSPTGDRIAYIATERDATKADLFVATAEGTDHVRLNGTLQTISRVRWSPAGDRIAYVGQIPPNGVIRLYTSAASGEEDSPVQVSTGVTEEPIWSPDGTHLAYLLSGEYKLAVNRGTGGDERIVSRDGETVTGVFPPTWSEDGSRLVYVVLDLETERRQLRSVRADGSDNVQIWDGIDQYSLFP